MLLALYDVRMPGNVGFYFHCLLQVAAFDFIDTDVIYTDLLDGRTTEPYTYNFGIMGLDSMWFLNNMGSMSIIMFLSPLLFLVSPGLYYFESRSSHVRHLRKYLLQ